VFEPGAPFAVGANLPWVRYGGDFGANRWSPHGGLVAGGVQDDLRTTLAQLGQTRSAIVRWFLFCDGRAGIRFSAEGEPVGLDPHVFQDLDIAIAAADASGVRIVFSLIDFLWCRRRRVVDDVPIHGRRGVLMRPTARAALIDRVFAPVFERYRATKTIAAWEVINEPEWVTLGLGSYHPLRAIRQPAMRAFIGETLETAHANASQPVTVGSAHARWLRWLRGLPLDFYQVHWYDRFDTRWPLATPVRDFGVDKPVVLGELPTRGSRLTPDTLVAAARDAGYAGAWLWSLRANDHATDSRRALAAMRAF
jgi:hypothetical protein